VSRCRRTSSYSIWAPVPLGQTAVRMPHIRALCQTGALQPWLPSELGGARLWSACLPALIVPARCGPGSASALRCSASELPRRARRERRANPKPNPTLALPAAGAWWWRTCAWPRRRRVRPPRAAAGCAAWCLRPTARWCSPRRHWPLAPARLTPRLRPRAARRAAAAPATRARGRRAKREAAAAAVSARAAPAPRPAPRRRGRRAWTTACCAARTTPPSSPAWRSRVGGRAARPAACAAPTPRP